MMHGSRCMVRKCVLRIRVPVCVDDGGVSSHDTSCNRTEQNASG